MKTNNTPTITQVSPRECRWCGQKDGLDRNRDGTSCCRWESCEALQWQLDTAPADQKPIVRS